MQASEPRVIARFRGLYTHSHLWPSLPRSAATHSLVQKGPGIDRPRGPPPRSSPMALPKKSAPPWPSPRRVHHHGPPQEVHHHGPPQEECTTMVLPKAAPLPGPP